MCVRALATSGGAAVSPGARHPFRRLNKCAPRTGRPAGWMIDGWAWPGRRLPSIRQAGGRCATGARARDTHTRGGGLLFVLALVWPGPSRLIALSLAATATRQVQAARWLARRLVNEPGGPNRGHDKSVAPHARAFVQSGDAKFAYRSARFCSADRGQATAAAAPPITMVARREGVARARAGPAPPGRPEALFWDSAAWARASGRLFIGGRPRAAPPTSIGTAA